MAVFTQQDGQLALGSKTPVSILQEILHKKGLIPQYELIYNGVGTSEPLFKYRVSAEGQTAIGDGKSKKEAKHDAAASLLKRLLNNNPETEKAESKEEVDIASPYTGALKTNYVGKLDEISFVNKIPNPNYVLIAEDGPPHARVFTMKCELSSISEIAVARTKKQAKHLVAQKMIERLSKILKERFIPALENDELDEVISDQEKIKNGSFHHDLMHKVQDLHNVFHLRKDEQPLPSIFEDLPKQSEEFYDSLENPLEFLEKVADALHGVVKKKYITKKDFDKALRELEVFCEDEYEADESDCENQEPGHSNRTFDSLPDFPLSDDEESKDDKTVEKPLNTDIIEKIEHMTVDDFDPVYSFLKFEVPIGFWDFFGQGRSNEEGLKQAACRALKFLRIVAIPPQQNSL